MERREELTDYNGEAAALPPFRAIAADSRTVRPGDLFITWGRGVLRLHEAFANGAVAAVVPGDSLPDARFSRDHRVLRCARPQSLLGILAARTYGRKPQYIAAVTGTNGKSSVVSYIRYLWECRHIRCAAMGTLGLQVSPGVHPGSTAVPGLTTFDTLTLHKLLQELAEQGVTHVAMEASSHGLDQYRLHDVPLSVAAFTNLTRDHLDYHGSMESYFAAKAKLFSEVLPKGGTAVLNLDSPYTPALLEIVRERSQFAVTCSLRNPEATLLLRDLRPVPTGLEGELVWRGKSYGSYPLPVFGLFQGENILTALGSVLTGECDIEALLPFLCGLHGAPGRLERVGVNAAQAPVFVDYAHTPDALRHAMAALRVYACGRLITVFGCGGNRDAGKRPLMGGVAAEGSDIVIVTDDNPRDEDPAVIRREIMAGCPDALEIADRGQAIAHAVTAARAGDVVLIAGKGHEQGQIIADVIYPFSDAQYVREILRTD